MHSVRVYSSLPHSLVLVLLRLYPGDELQLDGAIGKARLAATEPVCLSLLQDYLSSVGCMQLAETGPECLDQLVYIMPAAAIESVFIPCQDVSFFGLPD